MDCQAHVWFRFEPPTPVLPLISNSRVASWQWRIYLSKHNAKNGIISRFDRMNGIWSKHSAMLSAPWKVAVPVWVKQPSLGDSCTQIRREGIIITGERAKNNRSFSPKPEHRGQCHLHSFRIFYCTVKSIYFKIYWLAAIVFRSGSKPKSRDQGTLISLNIDFLVVIRTSILGRACVVYTRKRRWVGGYFYLCIAAVNE